MPGESIVTRTTVRPAPRDDRPVGRRHQLVVLTAVGVGGALGGMARYGLAEAWPVRSGRFPWTTLATNLAGSLVLGVVVTVVVAQWPPSRYLRPFLAAGLCGGFTTWSTFMVESTLLVRDGHALLAAAYVVVALVSGLAATAAGMWIGRRSRRPARRPAA